MPVFKDSESIYELVPEGDYILCVYEFTTDISTGKKTHGCDRYTIVFNIEGTESKVKEQLLDHESTMWKIGTFLKSSGIRALKEGQPFHFEKDRAEEQEIPWINPMGLRCHAAVIQDKYTLTKTGKEVTKNKVAVFYTDRPVLSPDPVLRNKPTNTSKSAPEE